MNAAAWPRPLLQGFREYVFDGVRFGKLHDVHDVSGEDEATFEQTNNGQSGAGVEVLEDRSRPGGQRTEHHQSTRALTGRRRLCTLNQPQC